MPVFLNPPKSLQGKVFHPLLPHAPADYAARGTEILLVILMADKKGAEAHFKHVLEQSSAQVTLTLAVTDDYMQKVRADGNPDEQRAHVRNFYHPWGEASKRSYHGIAITGMNGKKPHLRQEDIWPAFQEICAWSSSRDNVTSALYSCLAAQAALLCRHGIERRRLAEKNHGVFEHDILADSAGLLRGLTSPVAMPVSRWNEIDEHDVRKRPELELALRAPGAGVGLIVEQPASRKDPLAVYLLGHPEYDAGVLAREYDRDHAAKPEAPWPKNYQRDVCHWQVSQAIYKNWVNALQRDFG